MSSRKAAPDCQRFWLKESDLKGSACQSIQIASNSLVIKCARHAARWRPNAEICEPRFSTQRSMRVISRCQVDRQISAKKHTKKNKERRPEKSEMRLIDRKRNRRHKSFIALASFLLLGELVNYTLVSAVLYGALKLLPCKLALETVPLHSVAHSVADWQSSGKYKVFVLFSAKRLPLNEYSHRPRRLSTGYCLAGDALLLERSWIRPFKVQRRAFQAITLF